MRVAFSLFVEKMKSSFWILPSLVAIAIVALLAWLQGIEIRSDHSFLSYLLLYDASPQGARLILSSIATAVMTVVGVLFSITILVLQQVSNQYAPRVIQNFVRSTPSQLVLGFYLGTFSYCLLLLRKIHDQGAGVEVAIPRLAMSFGIVLAVVSICLLILYVHHITSSIQSTRIISNVTDDTLAAIRDIVSDRAHHVARERARFEATSSHATTICAKRRGYLQGLAWRRLGKPLNGGAWRLRALAKPGDYLQEGAPVLKVTGPRILDTRARDRLLESLRMGTSRTQAQDPEFGVRQLVDIALRALSPGINDPSTAIEALHGIGSILLAFCEHYPLAEVLRIGDGCLLELRPIEADAFVGLCFDQVIQFGRSHSPVLLAVARLLEAAEERTRDRDLRLALALRREATAAGAS